MHLIGKLPNVALGYDIPWHVITYTDGEMEVR
jgi:hypothetical protein